MPHIHTEPGQIDFTVTAYIVRDDGVEPRAMLHMHRKQQMLLPVGGHIELTETPWTAIAHEIEEESGYTFDDLEILQPKLRLAQYRGVVVHPQPIFVNTHNISDTHWHTDLGYLFLTHGDPSRQPQDGESADIRWLTRGEIAALDRSVIYENTQEVSLAALDTFIHAWEPLSATSFSTDKLAR